jgi:hypothetical protein
MCLRELLDAPAGFIGRGQSGFFVGSPSHADMSRCRFRGLIDYKRLQEQKQRSDDLHRLIGALGRQCLAGLRVNSIGELGQDDVCFGCPCQACKLSSARRAPAAS